MQVLGTKIIGRKVLLFDTLPSTNDLCRSLAEKDEPEGTVVVSDVQTAGRGRLDHKWFSAEPAGLYLSVLLRPDFSQEYFPLIGLLAAIAVQKTITALTGIKAAVKRPNDVLIDGKKTAGILSEQRGRTVVTGIGVNINNPKASFPEELRDKATSLMIETGVKMNKEYFMVCLLRQFDMEYDLLKSGKFKAAQERIELIIG